MRALDLTKAIPVGLLAVSAAASPVFAEVSKPDFTALSLRELMSIEVTTASRKREELGEVAAAVTVITSEDIKLSAARTVPDLLRTVPGLQVARLDPQTWAVSARGFNDLVSNKLLVLVDGRSVYSSLFSGTFWQLHQIPLDIIDRIEVIRGPGATLWGANAMNGVINVITNSASAMQETSISFGAGNEERASTLLTHGGAAGSKTRYAAYLSYFDRDGPVNGAGEDVSGDWWEGRGGARVDWAPTERDQFEFRGDAAQGQTEDNLRRLSLTAPYRSIENTANHYYTANLSGRWTRAYAENHEVSILGYWNYWYLDRLDRHQTFAFDLQHRFPLGSWNDITWGLEYRLVESDPGADNDRYSFTIGSQIDQVVSGFVQDQISLVPDELDLTVGSKFEYNTLTGFEYQPSARLRWLPDDGFMLWGAISRAVRTPSVGERTVSFVNTVLAPGEGDNNTPFPLQVVGTASPDQESERLLTYELGGRWQVGDQLSLEPALFYSVYDNLGSTEVGDTTFDAGALTTPLTGDNKISGEAYGFELAATAQPLDRWRVRASYSYLNIDLRPDADSTDASSVSRHEGSSPRHQDSLTNVFTLADGLRASLGFRYVDDLPAQDTDAYLGMDAKVVWQPRDGVELSLSGRDLLQVRHREFGDNTFFVLTEGSDVERSVFGQLKVRF